MSVLVTLPELRGARCKGHPDPDLFHDPNREREAVDFCRQCPVRAECFAWALTHPAGGVWGGTTELQRRRLAHEQGRSYWPANNHTDWLHMPPATVEVRHRQADIQRQIAAEKRRRASEQHAQAREGLPVIYTCRRGHECTAIDVHHNSRGQRKCRFCALARQALQREARRR